MTRQGLPFSWSVVAAPVLGALALCACGHSSPTRFWTLETVAPAQATATRSLAPVRVDSVRVPAALDRVEVVQQTAGRRLALRDFDHWGAPLGDLIRQTLSRDLIARLPAGAVVFPGAPMPQNARGLVVDVLDLQPGGEGYVMDVSWTLMTQGSSRAVQRGQFRLETASPDNTVASQTAATSRLVGQLADRIAGALVA